MVSLMRYFRNPLLMNQEVSPGALTAYISGEQNLLSVLMNSPLTTPPSLDAQIVCRGEMLVRVRVYCFSKRFDVQNSCLVISIAFEYGDVQVDHAGVGHLCCVLDVGYSAVAV